jgi:hypothetical protein
MFRSFAALPKPTGKPSIDRYKNRGATKLFKNRYAPA